MADIPNVIGTADIWEIVKKHTVTMVTHWEIVIKQQV